MIEHWKPICGHEELYEVSTLGRVRSKVANKLLAPCGGQQYPYVALYKNGRRVDRALHIVVLSTFVGPRPPGLWGLHKDDDQNNNALSNLYWGTPKDNQADSARNGTRPLGSRHPNAKRNEDEVIEMRELHRQGTSCYELARRFGMGQPAVRDICNRRTWRHVE